MKDKKINQTNTLTPVSEANTYEFCSLKLIFIFWPVLYFIASSSGRIIFNFKSLIARSKIVISPKGSLRKIFALNELVSEPIFISSGRIPKDISEDKNSSFIFLF